MGNLQGRIVAVTGASGGLGEPVLQALRTKSATAVGIARSIANGIQAELSSPAEALAAIDKVYALHGRMDGLVHLVGGFAGGATVAETPRGTFDSMFQLNVGTAFNVLQATLPRMRAAGMGRIVLIGSRAALEPSPGAAAYAASKAALVSLTRTVAAENKDRGITANILLPSTIDTPANRKSMPTADFSRWVDPKQVAALICFLLSTNGTAINGVALPVYGGDA